jgi:DNA-binding transcriptional ArsR family regulator
MPPANSVYKALSEPTRRRILALLRERDMTAGELASSFDVSWPTMSGHFAVLKSANLIQADRIGTSIRYHLNMSVLEEALLALMDTFGVDLERPARPGRTVDRDRRSSNERRPR